MTVEDIEAEWASCRRCPLAGPRPPCRGVALGDPGLPVVLAVSEPPGRRQEASGCALTAADAEVAVVMLAGTSAYVSPAVACRPPGDRDPTTAEVLACRPRLDALAAALAPVALAFLGAKATGPALGLAGYPQAVLPSPAVIRSGGWPSTWGRRAAEGGKAKLGRLLAAALRPRKAKAKTKTKAPSEPEAAQAPVEHVHEWEAVGRWRGEGGEASPMLGCACGALAPSKASRRAKT